VRYWYDGAEKARFKPLELLLFARGREVERAYLDNVAKESTSFLDIHDLPRRAQVDATLKAMADGIDFIGHPLFAVRQAGKLAELGIQLTGEADLIRRVTTRRLPSGLFGYEVVEIKSSFSVHPYHEAQLAHYTTLVGGVTGHELEYGAVVILAKGPEYDFVEVPVDLQRPMSEVVRFLQDDLPRIATDPKPDFHLQSMCGQCAYRQQCETDAVEEAHLSLLAGLRKRQRADLMDAGVQTWPELAVPRPEFTKIEQGWQGATWTLERIRQQAMAQAYETSLDRASLLEPLRALLPQSGSGRAVVGEARIPGRVVGVLDLEGDPLQGNIYLYGYSFDVLSRAPRADGHIALEAPVQRMSIDVSEADLFEEFLDAMDARRRELGELVIIHYGNYEPSQLKTLARRHSHIKDVAERVAQLRGECVDLLATVKYARALPVRSYSLKEVAPCLARITQGRHGHVWGGPTDRSALYQFLRSTGMGFTEAKHNVDVVQRSADHWDLSLAEILKPSAGSSVLWYREQFNNAAPVWGALIRAYNHDDLLATWAVASWLLDQLYLEIQTTNVQHPMEVAG